MNNKKFNLLLKLKKVKKSRSIQGLNTLNKEKSKLSNIQESLGKILETAQFPEGEEMTSSFLRQISTYQNQIQDKLNTSLNRQKYLSSEILNNINELSKLNKQTEIIEKKISTIKKEKDEILEKKSEITILNKASF
ncbi:MAG: hypothetical protein CMP37_00340 [Rickettsiales bacterium]|jgi:hypothetical protein|nr:hypothetical protein [Rickettsiales bacterium]OUW73071.1 MAG: hypothetical protein CBD71_00380 [Rickettsiales bacterium TMED211]